MLPDCLLVLRYKSHDFPKVTESCWVLQRFALKPEPRIFLKVLRSNTFKKILGSGSFDRELL